LHQWAISNTSWLLFIFCLQQMYKHLSGSVWSEGVWSVWSVSCWAGRCKGSTVPSSFNRVPSGPRSILDTKGKKISALHQETTPYIVWTVRDIYNIQKRETITRQADRDKPIWLGTPHVLNFRQNTMREGFRSQDNPNRNRGRQFVTGTGFAPRTSNFAENFV
jgi:hypothetical protein